MIDRPSSIHPEEVDIAAYAVILDIRPHAASSHTLPGSTFATTDVLTTDPSGFITSTADSALIVCDIGVRSRVVTEQLHSLGYRGAVSLDGGVEAWLRSGLATEHPSGLLPDEFTRYDRQLKLPGFGIEGQTRLRAAKVAVVGVGGLGTPVLSYLAAAGVGHITVIDSDRVEASNLHRQPIYSTADVGAAKAETAASFAAALNPSIEIAALATRLDTTNAKGVLADHDVVVVCTDSFETAHAINSAAVKLEIPLVFGSVYRTEGQFAVFDAASGPCYACVFPSTDVGAALDCSIVGVLGPVTGVIGAIQATETIKVLTGIGASDSHLLRLYDAMGQTLDSLRIRKDPTCTVCSG